jgi:hypothetical protein
MNPRGARRHVIAGPVPGDDMECDREPRLTAPVPGRRLKART